MTSPCREHSACIERFDVADRRRPSLAPSCGFGGEVNRRTTVKEHFIDLMVAGWCAIASAGIAHAQETINDASLGGRVTDPQGAVVRGAAVSARHIDTNVTADTMTDAEGRFRFPYLRVGPYELKVHVAGFADSLRTLRLTVGAAFDVPISLTVRGLETAVTVTGEAPVLEAARSQIAGTVPQIEVQRLPMNSRNFLDLALLIPGVSPTNIGSTQLFPETSAVPGQGISVASQRNLSNMSVKRSSALRSIPRTS
jgi:hypothetical protein